MNTEWEDTIRKNEYRLSELRSSDEYDFNKITSAEGIFLACTIEFENETALFVYDIKGKKEFSKLLEEDQIMKLKVLIDIGHFQKYWNRYIFSIHPDNLYYDMYGKVSVMFRDIYNTEEDYGNNTHLEEYKALIGYVLSGKYSYDDYFQGGMNLLKKDKFLRRIAEVEDWEGLVALLQQEAERVMAYNKEKKIVVERTTYAFRRLMTGICFLMTGVLIFCVGYYLLHIRPYDSGVIQAQNAYLDTDYLKVIESLQDIAPGRLDNYQKYILATSYIKCENLTDEQKDNVLAAVEIHGNEKILDYWISIGRLEVEDAEDIAQQISDDQLLVYAYLKERYVLEANTEISGEEKNSQMQNLDEKIQSITGEENTESTGE